MMPSRHQRHLEKLPHFEGIAIDRLDYSEFFNYDTDDNISWVPRNGTGVDGLRSDLSIWGPASHWSLSPSFCSSFPVCFVFPLFDGGIAWKGTYVQSNGLLLLDDVRQAQPYIHACTRARARACKHLPPTARAMAWLLPLKARALRLAYRHTFNRLHETLHPKAIRKHTASDATVAGAGRNVEAEDEPTDKMMLNNCNLLCRLDEMRAFDGTFSEGASLNSVVRVLFFL